MLRLEDPMFRGVRALLVTEQSHQKWWEVPLVGELARAVSVNVVKWWGLTCGRTEVWRQPLVGDHVADCVSVGVDEEEPEKGKDSECGVDGVVVDKVMKY